MSADLRHARRAFRQAATLLRQAAHLTPLDSRTRELVLLQAVHAEAEAVTVDRRLVDAAEYRRSLRKGARK